MGRLLFWLMVAQASLPALAVDWSSLERYQQTITRAEFDKLVLQVYAPTGALTNYLTYSTNSVSVYSTSDKIGKPLFTLRFGSDPLPLLSQPPSFKRIVLDPGHIGGEWARMEERYFVRGNDRPVQEAVLNLTVARRLKPRLEAAGATVFLSKDNLEPVTDKRPDDFRVEAERYATSLTDFSVFPPLEREAAVADAARNRAEKLFYRSAEIAARARRINEQLKPDLTICIHFNAVEWNECHDLVDDNRLVVFVHGNYLDSELVDDEQKFHLFVKLLERTHWIELAAAESIAAALATATELPPVKYGPNSGAVRVGTNSYVFARNLAANRLVDGPVVFLEPYYMNNRTVYQRIQLGDYVGTREIDGKAYKSIFREYADAVSDGLSTFCGR
ncbi:MAG TPA: N-acetylmuramoyl-L-alanine amidase [Verrucomicrobiae bacterium]|nr:N-acetylmuramoyl-L-alanine amidase [Verrucomicrobiae bacterium]